MKENVIVGRLIPAGTGSVMNRLRRIAADRDKAVIAQRAAEAPALDVAESSAERLKLRQIHNILPPDPPNLAVYKKKRR